MNCTYLSCVDKYLLSTGEIYTDDDLDNLITIEREWRKDQLRYTFSQLIDIFPEAVKPARRGLKQEIKRREGLISQINTEQEAYQEGRINKAHFSEQNYLRKESDNFFNNLRKKQESKIKSCVFQLSSLDEIEGKAPIQKFNGVNEAQVDRAKDIPIESLYDGRLKKHRNRAVGVCEFHTEKTPSLTIYTDQNRWHCYGCNTGGSAVDYIMKKNNIDFLPAVKLLLR